MLVSGKMAITPLWKELGEEVIPFLKTTGSKLSDEHKNFMILSKMTEKIAFEVGNPTSKKRKNRMRMLYFRHPVFV